MAEEDDHGVVAVARDRQVGDVIEVEVGDDYAARVVSGRGDGVGREERAAAVAGRTVRQERIRVGGGRGSPHDDVGDVISVQIGYGQRSGRLGCAERKQRHVSGKGAVTATVGAAAA